MPRTVFISCGQFTPAEKALGSGIAQMVKDAGLDPFFAQDVRSLDGLDSNILRALRDCVAFIAVMHPRGEIKRPDGRALTRASIWIEQEIAIATYIQRIEKRPIEIIAFRHADVGLEGLRSLIQLNPIEFVDDSEVLDALPELLRGWRALSATGIEVRLESEYSNHQQGHSIRALSVVMANNSSTRIAEYDAELFIPKCILKHWNATQALAAPSSDPNRLRVRFSNHEYGPIGPGDTRTLFRTEYCTQCAVEGVGGVALGSIVDQYLVSLKVWTGGREYSDEVNVRELAEKRDSSKQARRAL